MGTFFRRLTLFALVPFAVAIITLLAADGRTDPYYLRFTTPRQSSLILGSSRPAQGIRPQVLDSVLRAHGKEVRSFNYGFALGYSNYGGSYLNSILRKLDPKATDGVFVLAVDPWGVADTHSPGATAPGKASSSFIATMKCVNMDPNIEYLLTVYDQPLLSILFPDRNSSGGRMLLHEDGWLEVEVPMLPAEVEKRTQAKLKEYRTQRLPGAAISAVRTGYLALTIDTLQEHGTVLLVRLPVDPRMLALEDSFAPHFNKLMQAVSRSKGVEYLDFSGEGSSWAYTDGNHLAPESGAGVTAVIAEHLAKVMDGTQQ
ncbi:MAG: hypothetical protein JNL43_14300 [Flavobacteriales bacterium]|nr:hypothetical protein [Flavobacteriales bacterium]